MLNDLTQLTAFDLLAQYRSKSLSPVEATQAVLNRIEQLQPHYNAYRAVDGEAALMQARAAEKRWQRGEPAGILDGVPVAVKDRRYASGGSSGGAAVAAALGLGPLQIGTDASVPAGFDRNGLPVGLQIIGPQYADALVLRAARAFERAHPITTPHLASLRPARLPMSPVALL